MGLFVINFAFTCIVLLIMVQKQNTLEKKFNSTIEILESKLKAVLEENRLLKDFVKQIFSDNKDLYIRDKSMLKYIT